MDILEKHDLSEFQNVKVGKYGEKDIWEIAVEFKSSTYREHIFLQPEELQPGEEAEYGTYDLEDNTLEIEYEIEQEIEQSLEEIEEELKAEEELLTS